MSTSRTVAPSTTSDPVPAASRAEANRRSRGTIAMLQVQLAPHGVCGICCVRTPDRAGRPPGSRPATKPNAATANTSHHDTTIAATRSSRTIGPRPWVQRSLTPRSATARFNTIIVPIVQRSRTPGRNDPPESSRCPTANVVADRRRAMAATPATPSLRAPAQRRWSSRTSTTQPANRSRTTTRRRTRRTRVVPSIGQPGSPRRLLAPSASFQRRYRLSKRPTRCNRGR